MNNRLERLADVLIEEAPVPPTLDQLQTAGSRQVVRRQVGFVASVVVAAGLLAGIAGLAVSLGPTDTAAVADPDQDDTNPEGRTPAASTDEEVSCMPPSDDQSQQRASSEPQTSRPTGLDPTQVAELGIQLKAVFGDGFTSISTNANEVVILGTQPEPGPDLSEIGARFDVVLSYRQVNATAVELEAAERWLTDLVRSPGHDLDLRTAYVDGTCGKLVGIVGDDATAAAIETQARGAGHGEAITIFVRPDYVVGLRGPAGSEGS